MPIAEWKANPLHEVSNRSNPTRAERAIERAERAVRTMPATVRTTTAMIDQLPRADDVRTRRRSKPQRAARWKLTRAAGGGSNSNPPTQESHGGGYFLPRGARRKHQTQNFLPPEVARVLRNWPSDSWEQTGYMDTSSAMVRTMVRSFGRSYVGVLWERKPFFSNASCRRSRRGPTSNVSVKTQDSFRSFWGLAQEVLTEQPRS